MINSFSLFDVPIAPDLIDTLSVSKISIFVSSSQANQINLSNQIAVNRQASNMRMHQH
jgi:hypothetical protein